MMSGSIQALVSSLLVSRGGGFSPRALILAALTPPGKSWIDGRKPDGRDWAPSGFAR
jgi:hypothetical protein